MKRFILLIVIAAVFVLTSPVFAAKPIDTDAQGNEVSWLQTACTTIQDGLLVYRPGHYLAGEPLETGFDAFGYNYQGHLFKGSYANVYLGGDGFPPYEGDDVAYAQRLADECFVTNPYAKWYWPYRAYNLQMKWNDAWIANTDCDDDGLLDRHYGYPSYVGSGAWETNQYGDGEAYLIKIVAVPEDAYLSAGYWYTADGTEIGPTIWGEFAIVQEEVGGEGAVYVSPAGPGYGQY